MHVNKSISFVVGIFFIGGDDRITYQFPLFKFFKNEWELS